jgi:hypothetical protein
MKHEHRQVTRRPKLGSILTRCRLQILSSASLPADQFSSNYFDRMALGFCKKYSHRIIILLLNCLHFVYGPKVGLAHKLPVGSSIYLMIISALLA